MKKKILLGILVIVGLFTITGCKEKRTIDYLMKGYVNAYTNADLKAVKDIFPPYYLEYNKKSLNQKSLDSELKSAKNLYGDNFNITYKVEKEIKFTDKELNDYNKKIKDIYKSDDSAKECYKYEGTVTLKGSKKTSKLKMSTIARCNFDGTWYLVRK